MPVQSPVISMPTNNQRKIGAHVSTAGGLTKAIDNTLSIGGNCLQIFAGSPRAWARPPFNPIQVNAFNKKVAENQLGPVFIHALYLVNLASDNPELLHKSTASLIADLNNGELINSAGVIVHLGSHQGRGFDITSGQIIALINQILRETRGVPFVIENSAGQNGKIGNLAEIKYLFDEIQNERLKLCLDTAHLFEAGYDLRETPVVESLIKEITDLGLLSELVCLHLNDSKTALNSKHDQHANLGDGQIGLVGLANFVKHSMLKHLPLLLEVPGDHGFPDSKQIDLAKSL